MAEKERIGLFEGRHKELKRRHLVEYAAQEAGILREDMGDTNEDIVEMRLVEANKGMDNDQAMEVVEKLQEVGYLWNDNGVLVPGISSLFDFVMRKHERIKRLQSRQ